MAETSSSRSRIWITLAVLLIAAALLYYMLPASRDRVVVRAARVDREPLINVTPTNGRVEPLEDYQAHAPIPSVIEAIPIKLGQQVVRGQELVRLDATDAQSKIAAAQASLTAATGTLANMRSGGTQDELLSERNDLANARAQQADAERSLQALQALQAKGAASANEVTAAQQKLTDAQTRVGQLQARMHGRDRTTARATPPVSTAASKAARSKRSPSAVLARSRRRRISLWPVL